MYLSDQEARWYRCQRDSPWSEVGREEKEKEEAVRKDVFSFSTCPFDTEVDDRGRDLVLVALLIELMNSRWIDKHSVLAF